VIEPEFETALPLRQRGERIDAGGDDLPAATTSVPMPSPGMAAIA
jgi:hypothetical protein